MKKLQPFVMLVALGVALLGALLLIVNKEFSPLPVGLLAGGLLTSVAMGLRATSRGIDTDEHAAAIRARAQANWNAAKKKDAG